MHITQERASMVNNHCSLLCNISVQTIDKDGMMCRLYHSFMTSLEMFPCINATCR